MCVNFLQLKLHDKFIQLNSMEDFFPFLYVDGGFLVFTKIPYKMH